MNINISDYKQKGLYLILKDSKQLDLTKENIEEVSKKYWEDSKKFPASVKEADDFQKCPICPFLDQEGGICESIRLLFPFLENLDNYVSFDKVTAIYKGAKEELIHLSDTTMQQALEYVSILSLTQYCQNGQKYRKYFLGIIPLMDIKEISTRIYLNIYWLHNRNQEGVNGIISKFNEELKTTTRNQLKRLNLVFKNDTFKNALVNTQAITEYLTMDMKSILNESFDNVEKHL